VVWAITDAALSGVVAGHPTCADWEVVQHEVGKEYVRPMVPFLTNDLAAVRTPGWLVMIGADVHSGSRALDNGRSEPIATALAFNS
jgi:hypothetical protein